MKPNYTAAVGYMKKGRWTEAATELHMPGHAHKIIQQTVDDAVLNSQRAFQDALDKTISRYQAQAEPSLKGWEQSRKDADSTLSFNLYEDVKEILLADVSRYLPYVDDAFLINCLKQHVNAAKGER